MDIPYILVSTMYLRHLPFHSVLYDVSVSHRRIEIEIDRNISAKEYNNQNIGLITELQRDIINPEEVIIKRREGKNVVFL